MTLYDEITELSNRIYSNPSVIMGLSLSKQLIYVEDKGKIESKEIEVQQSSSPLDLPCGAVHNINIEIPQGVERFEVYIDEKQSKRTNYMYSGMRYSTLFNHMVKINIYCNADYYKRKCLESPQDVANFSHCINFVILDFNPIEDNLTVLDILSPIVWFANYKQGSYTLAKKYIEGFNRSEVNLTDRVLLHNTIKSRCLLNYELVVPDTEHLTVQELYSSVNHYITNEKFIYDFSSYDKDRLISKIENLKENKIKLDLMDYNVANISIDIHENSYQEDMELLRYLYANADSFIYATKLCFGINCVDIKSETIYDNIFKMAEDLNVPSLSFQNASFLVNFTTNAHLKSYLKKNPDWLKDGNKMISEKVAYISNAKQLIVKTGLHDLRDSFETVYLSNLLISNVKLQYDVQTTDI